jgi:photosystem II stability/assembly factor-like uncharacterized protein
MAELKAMKATSTRVWYVEGGVHPANTPKYLSNGKFGDDPSKSIGEDTRITAPSPDRFGEDVTVGTMKGEEERASFGIAVRSTKQASVLMGWKNKRCKVDFFALMGECGNPQDFTEGGEKHVYFSDGKISSFNYENFGAFGRDENNPLNEMVDCTSADFWEYLYLRQDTLGASATIREIYTVDVDPGDGCDECPDVGSNIFLTMAGTAATPGTAPVLLWSKDGGETWYTQSINVMFSNENIVEGHVIGGLLVLISNTANAVIWTRVSEIYEGVNTWQRVDTGFVTGKQPNAFTFANVNNTWIAGNGGYIYFADNIKSGVEVQDAGIATTQDLLSINAANALSVLAVGKSNAVVYTENGGKSWEAVSGPSVGVNLSSCWMWDEKTWLVGEGSGGTGKLWLTTDRGITWTQVSLPATYLQIDKIAFASQAEGYISARSGGQSFILRSITGGNKWSVLPNGKKGIAVNNTYLKDIATTTVFGNLAYAAGLANNGTAGLVLKMSGS